MRGGGGADVQAGGDLARSGAEAHGITLWTVNGEPFGTDSAVARPVLGATTKWTIREQNVEHPCCEHLAGFQVTRREGNDEGTSAGRDTVHAPTEGRDTPPP